MSSPQNCAKHVALLVFILLFIGILGAQRQMPAPDMNTEEGKLLQQIADESDVQRKTQLLEEFAARYPNNAATAWVYEQLTDSYRSSNEPDKLLASGERILAIDPFDFSTAQTCLNAALQMKNDPDLVIKWAETLSNIADLLSHSPGPSDENDTTAWETRVTSARLASAYSESALYEAARQSHDPYKILALGATLAQHNSESDYTVPMAKLQFSAYLQIGDTENAFHLAQTTLKRAPANVEMLLNLASLYRGRHELEKALKLTQHATVLTNQQETPEGMNDSEWTQRQQELLCFAEYLEGTVYAATGKWSDADVQLRASLPGIRSRQNTAEALYYLGLANYRLAEQGDLQRASDALLFSTLSADIPGNFQQLARQNASSIRTRFQLQ
jgi:hypothetical protein